MGEIRRGALPIFPDPVPKTGIGEYDRFGGLCLLDGDCTGFTYLYTTFAAKTFFSVYRR